MRIKPTKKHTRKNAFSFRSISLCASIVTTNEWWGARCETFFGCLIGYSNLHTDCTVMWLKRLWVWFLCLHILAGPLCLVSICRHSCRWVHIRTHTHTPGPFLVSRQPFSNSVLLSDLTEATRVSIQTQSARVCWVNAEWAHRKLFVFVGSMCISLFLLGDNVSASQRLPFFFIRSPFHCLAVVSSVQPTHGCYPCIGFIETAQLPNASKLVWVCRVRIRYFCRPKNLFDFVQVAKCVCSLCV